MASKRRSANPGNLRTGLTAKVSTVGVLPTGLSRVARRVKEFVQTLEDLVFATHGEITARHSLVIQSAGRWEQASCLAHRWLSEHFETMSHSERLSYAEGIAKFSTNRDRAVEKLRLDVDTKSALESLYAMPTVIDAQESDADSKPQKLN